MKNKGVFYALSALLGVLAVFQSFSFSIIILGFLLIFLHKRKKFSRIYLSVVLFIFFVFFIRAEIEAEHNQTSLSGDEQTFQLLFNEIGQIDGDMLTISATEPNYHEKLVIKYRVKSEKEKKYLQQALSPGLICKVNGKLEEPSTSTNENAFDYKTYLERNHIHWMIKPDQINLQACRTTSGFITNIKKFRAEGIQYLESHFPDETVPLAAALLFGTSELMAKDTMDNYRELGIVHLLAISGLHITIIVAFAYFLLLRIGVTRERSIVLLLVCLPVYCVLTGASPSVNRSVLMTMLLLIGSRWGNHHRVNLMDCISLTFFLYVFAAPYAIFNIGFQLSFLVTFSILVSAPFILSRYEHPVSLLLSTSFLSMLCSAPLLLYFFFEFSIISVLVNLLYIPLFNVVLLPYILFLFIFHLLFGNFVSPFFSPLNEIIMFMNKFTEKMALLPWNTLVLGRPSPLFLLLYGWGLFLFFDLWEKGVKGKWRGLLFFSPFLLFTGQYMITNYSLEGEITFLDVGQGDCIFIKLPFGNGHYLIDTGGNMEFEQAAWQVRNRQYEVGRDTVVPFLKSKGVTTIDKLILTHGDNDHAGGAAAVLRELKVKEVVLPDLKERNKLENELIQHAINKKIPVRFVHAGDSWKTGEYHFQILSPEEQSHAEGNDGSIVLFTELGGLKWLFTGDLEVEGEGRLIRMYPSLSVDVLKVGHHGSKSSTTDPLLEQISPQIAVISVGENNRYHHPHQEVIDRLAKRKIITLRTDISGAVTYTFKKELGTFSIHHP